MSDEAAREEEDLPKRNAASAWKQAQEAVAKRNEQARKAGKQEREAYEGQKAAKRQAVERQRMARLLGEQARKS